MVFGVVYLSISNLSVVLMTSCIRYEDIYFVYCVTPIMFFVTDQVRFIIDCVIVHASVQKNIIVQKNIKKSHTCKECRTFSI